MFNNIIIKFSKPDKEIVQKHINSNKLKLLELITRSKLPPQGKIIAATILKQLNEETTTSIIKDFYLMLDHREEIQERIRTEFPTIITETRRADDDNRDDGIG